LVFEIFAESMAGAGTLSASSLLALQLYTVRDQLAADRRDVLQRIAGFGYAAVEPHDVRTDPGGLRADIAAAGLSVCSVHARPFGDQAEAAFSGAIAVGADTVIIPMMPPERFADRHTVGELAAELNEIAARAAGRGLRLGYHNHDFELSSVIGGRPALEVLADLLDPAVLLEVDTYWAMVGGQRAPELLGRLGDRVRYLHVKDGPVTKDDPMTAVGAGRMPVTEILHASESVEWNVVELDHCATDMLEAAGDSMAWLESRGLARRAGDAG
jgi:sugar phosphate isomerase/epimerase